MRKTFFSLFFLLVYLNGFGQTKIQMPAIFSDHVVLQQKMQIPIWGTAEPNSLVNIEIAGFASQTKANAQGKWMLRLPEMNAGGPFTLKIWNKDTIKINDVMIGEVWLASGQSNMQWQVGAGIGPNTDKEIAEANYPNLRYFNVNKQPSSIPLEIMGKAEWKACNSQTVKDLSAVAYFFGCEILKNKNLAVGIISASWGATSVETWMSAEMLRTHSDFTKRVDDFDRDPVKWKSYMQKSMDADRLRDSIAKAAKGGINKGVHQKEYNDKDWKICQYPMDMNSLNMSGYWGFVWFRKSFEISKTTKITDFELQLPINAKSFEIYFNGKSIEIKEDKSNKKQIYIIKSKNIVAGTNVLAIRIFQHWATGAIGLKETEANLVSLDKKTKISIAGEWRASNSIEPEVPQWQDYYNKINVLYNGMIAPVIPFGIKGAIWYQGENNAGKAFQYRTLFPMLIEDWRVRWQQGYFPFLFVQLANFKDKQAEPSDNDWAELREAQLMALKHPNTGMAVTIDIGEANDIHPKNKLDVGKRLFLAAQKIAYGENIVYSGPIYESMKMEGDKIRLSFTSVGTGLVAIL